MKKQHEERASYDASVEILDIINRINNDLYRRLWIKTEMFEDRKKGDNYYTGIAEILDRITGLYTELSRNVDIMYQDSLLRRARAGNRI